MKLQETSKRSWSAQFLALNSVEKPPKPAMRDDERKFKIEFGSEGEPDFEEVVEED